MTNASPSARGLSLIVRKGRLVCTAQDLVLAPAQRRRIRQERANGAAEEDCNTHSDRDVHTDQQDGQDSSDDDTYRYEPSSCRSYTSMRMV